MVNSYKEVTKHIKMIPEGQLSNKERLFLTELVTKIKPKKILESGTWKGGGSTLSLGKGLYENKSGTLDSYEEHKPFYEIAYNFYSNSIYNDYVNLYNESFLDGIKKLQDNYYDDLDLIFLDGGDENPNGLHKLRVEQYILNYNLSENLQSFIFLSTKMKSGTKILLHDWSIVEGRGNFIKRYLEDIKYEGFNLIDIIDGSTGMAFLEKK